MKHTLQPTTDRWSFIAGIDAKKNVVWQIDCLYVKSFHNEGRQLPDD